MVRIIAGATGLIGQHLVKHWQSQHIDVVVIGRSTDKIKRLFGDSVTAKTWDQLDLDLFRHADLVVNLAGKSLAEKRWTATVKAEILQSRVKSTETIAAYLAQLGENSPPLFNASAIGFYGTTEPLAERLPRAVDEYTDAKKFKDNTFLQEICNAWENAANIAIQKDVRVVFMRFAVVLAKEGGALPQLIRPFNFYIGGRVGAGTQAFSWIAIDDVIKGIDFLIDKQVKGPFNFSAPACVTQYELATTIGEVLHKPVFINTPGKLMEIALGKEMARELILTGQCVYPKRLLEMNYQFLFPQLKTALIHILKK